MLAEEWRKKGDKAFRILGDKAFRNGGVEEWGHGVSRNVGL